MPAVVQKAGFLNTVTNSGSENFTSTTVSGRLIVVAVAYYSLSTATASGADVTDNKGNTYQVADSNMVTGAAPSSAIYYCPNANGGASHAVNVSHTASSGEAISACIYEISGCLTVSPFDLPAHNNGTGSPQTSGATGTLAQAKEIAIAVTCVDTGSNAALTQDGAWTLGAEFEDGGSQLVYNSSYFVTTTSASLNHSWTWAGGGSDPWRASIATFKDTDTSGGATGKGIPAPSHRFQPPLLRR